MTTIQSLIDKYSSRSEGLTGIPANEILNDLSQLNTDVDMSMLPLAWGAIAKAMREDAAYYSFFQEAISRYIVDEIYRKGDGLFDYQNLYDLVKAGAKSFLDTLINTPTLKTKPQG